MVGHPAARPRSAGEPRRVFRIDHRYVGVGRHLVFELQSGMRQRLPLVGSRLHEGPRIVLQIPANGLLTSCHLSARWKVPHSSAIGVVNGHRHNLPLRKVEPDRKRRLGAQCCEWWHRAVFEVCENVEAFDGTPRLAGTSFARGRFRNKPQSARVQGREADSRAASVWPRLLFDALPIVFRSHGWVDSCGAAIRVDVKLLEVRSQQ